MTPQQMKNKYDGLQPKKSIELQAVEINKM